LPTAQRRGRWSRAHVPCSPSSLVPRPFSCVMILLSESWCICWCVSLWRPPSPPVCTYWQSGVAWKMLSLLPGISKRLSFGCVWGSILIVRQQRPQVLTIPKVRSHYFVSDTIFSFTN
jgi:hypothetical protein